MARKKKPQTKVKEFFKTIEGIWEAVPGYVKVFLYSGVSSAFGLFVAGKLDFMAVAIIVATNLGIYQVPRVTGKQIKKML